MLMLLHKDQLIILIRMQCTMLYRGNVLHGYKLGLSLLCFQILQLFFPDILFKFTYYSQSYSHILTIIPTKSSPF